MVSRLRFELRSYGLKVHSSPVKLTRHGSPSRVRTCNTSVNSRVLYH